ncbi:hypothetical protein B0H16DRAFT_1472398, partial [Mycena metata]
MDTSAIGRFHSTVAVLPGREHGMSPLGGTITVSSTRNLRFKVFLGCNIDSGRSLGHAYPNFYHHSRPARSSGLLRPAVFVLQQALDPSFHRTGYGRFEFPLSTTRMVQHSIRKLMELVHFISLTDPEYPS